MSAVNRFAASAIRYSEETRTVYLLIEYGARVVFPYTFCCKGLSAHLFFDMEKRKMLWIDFNQSPDSHGLRYCCATTSFWIEKDLPVPSVKGFMNQEIGVLAHIAEDFKEKLASYVLDGIINS